MTPPRGATAESLNRFRQATLADRAELRVELGDLVSAQELDVVVGITFPRGEPGEETAAEFRLALGGEPVPGAECRQAWSYATHHDYDVQPRNREVDRAVAELYAARARAEATEANRQREYDRARHVLEATAHRIGTYAGDDTELRHLAHMLREAVPEYAEAPMSAAALKMSVYASELVTKGRDTSGRARRGA